MGKGLLIKCKHCGYEREFYLGAGMMYPTTYKDLVKDIKKGKYGKELKEYFHTHKGAVVDAETVLYRCPECNKLEESYNLSLYVHKDDKEPENGYWCSWCDKEDYVFVKAYVHKCPKCGKRMKMTKENELNDLKCPKCGKPIGPSEDHFILWD